MNTALSPTIIRATAAAPRADLDAKIATVLKGSRGFQVIWVVGSALPAAYCWDLGSPIFRCLVVLEGLPVDPACLQAWRQWACGKDLKMVFIPHGLPHDSIVEKLKAICEVWLKPKPAREEPGVKLGTWVSMSASPGKHDPALLTMMFGSMGDLLTRMDAIERRFGLATQKVTADQINGYRKAVAGLLQTGLKGKLPAAANSLNVPIETLPRLLLLGETGVGKTLFARYLQGGSGRSFRRIVIPEYLGKEDMFEYDLFGYSRGAYTGGKIDGDTGQLLATVGGVVFLDEIGTASPVIQSKLLAYMDDYCVRPRGWSGEPFKCQTLVVAATNRPLSELQDRSVFRHDLLARFTDIEQVPPLQARKADLSFILDCLLQSEAINPSGHVGEIGKFAVESLSQHPFPGNFRELETVMRCACEAARKDDRNYVCVTDLVL